MHEEAFTAKTKTLFPQFGRFKQFYLVGGTALTLQIGHRISVDFDFFSEKELPARLLERVKRMFAAFPIQVTYRSPEQLNVLIGGVKATFFYYPYPIVEPLRTYQHIAIASVHEIAAMKALSIGGRLSYKDYIDWYFLLKEKYVHLAGVIHLANRKFGADFNSRLFLGQLASLEDVPAQKIDFLRGAVDRGTIKKFLDAAVRNFKF